MEKEVDGLDTKDIKKGTEAGLKKYGNLNFLEQYSMYMGVAQILEMRLKQILVNGFGGEFDNIENWSLGLTLNKLKQEGMREDFILMADSVKDARNYIAHELISNVAIWHSLAESKSEHYSKEARTLDKAIYEIEQLMFILEWNDKNGEWK